MRIFFAITFAVLTFCSNLHAQVIDSSFYQWTIYEMQSDELDEKKCYMVTLPINSESDQAWRGKPYLMITRYQNRRIEEIAVSSGFEYKINSKIFFALDHQVFRLPTNKDLAFARSRDDDAFIIQKMLSAATVKVRADSAIGTFAIDEYSLKGIAKAYSRMRAICK